MSYLAQINFDQLNQNIFKGVGPFASGTGTSLGTIINEVIKYVFPLAGLLLFFYIIFAGFSYLTSGGDPKAMEKAKGQITNAILGFVIIFAAYWLIQIFEYMFKIQIF